LEYFSSEGANFAKTVAALREEAEIQDTNLDASKGLLEKKWTSVVRLQRKVISKKSYFTSLKYVSSFLLQVVELESKLSLIQDDSNISSRPLGESGTSDSRGIPKAPARAVLSGHRAPVTCVAIHPVYRYGDTTRIQYPVPPIFTLYTGSVSLLQVLKIQP